MFRSQMCNLHVKMRVKTKVSVVETLHTKELTPERRSAASFWHLFLTAATFFLQQAFTIGKGVQLFQ